MPPPLISFLGKTLLTFARGGGDRCSPVLSDRMYRGNVAVLQTPFLELGVLSLGLD